jgi:cell division inhibitor SulA
MYHSTGVQKLSETQKSKLRNGHPVRIKKGSGNNLHLTDDQIKKLESAAKKGAAYTLTMHPEQAAKHKTGEGLFGDIAAKAKALQDKRKQLEALGK